MHQSRLSILGMRNAQIDNGRLLGCWKISLLKFPLFERKGVTDFSEMSHVNHFILRGYLGRQKTCFKSFQRAQIYSMQHLKIAELTCKVFLEANYLSACHICCTDVSDAWKECWIVEQVAGRREEWICIYTSILGPDIICSPLSWFIFERKHTFVMKEILNSFVNQRVRFREHIFKLLPIIKDVPSKVFYNFWTILSITLRSNFSQTENGG